MGSIGITVAHGSNSWEQSWDIDDGDIERLIAWAQAAYKKPVTPADPDPPALTPDEALAAWAGGLLQGTEANIKMQEHADAIAAIPQPPDMVAQPSSPVRKGRK